MILKSKNKLGLVFFPAFDWAISPSHPEREERLLYTQDQILEEGIEDIEGIKFYNPILASEKDVQRVHFCVPNVKDRVTNSHLISSGGAIEAFNRVINKDVDKAFAMVRPPGHHAQRLVYGDRGFCIVNNEAIMIENIRQKTGPIKVAIIDSDCHHGDGTEDIYWNDKDTLFISFHQDGSTLYPGTGDLEDLGGPSAYGYNINIPLPPGTGDEGILYVLNNLIMPILNEYKPDYIINSAGQDNHYSDPLTNMNFSAQGYARLNEILNPHIAVLEGGYSIQGALPYVNLGIILAMAGLDYSNVYEPDYHENKVSQAGRITEYIKNMCADIYKLWKDRQDLSLKKYQGLDQVQRQRQIYYDTDGILENQVENFHLCSRCSGLNTISSTSDRGHNIIAITIPRDSCSKCIDKGYNIYKSPWKSFTNLYLQDKVNDLYFQR